MILLDGKKVSAALKESLKQKVLKLSKPPCLAVVLVGDDPASQIYVRNKIKSCHAVGILSKQVRLPKSISMQELKIQIELLNKDKEVTAYLVQLPLPDHINKNHVLAWINPNKDADGLTAENLGLMLQGQPRVLPCTPKGVMAILQYYDIPIEGKTAVVVGRSQIVGLPMAHLLTSKNATVTVCHSKTKNLTNYTQQADIVVVAAGQAEFLDFKAFKKDAVVIDVGMHRNNDGTLCGDVDFQSVSNHVYALTPVPGGVGPMTIAMLLSNTIDLHQHC